MNEMSQNLVFRFVIQADAVVDYHQMMKLTCNICYHHRGQAQ